MIDGLIRWSLSHRPIVVALAAAFLWGGWTATRIPLDVLPDSRLPRSPSSRKRPGWIRWRSNRSSPSPSNPRSTVRRVRVRSATAVGVAVVWVEFDWGQDINRARQTVTELTVGSLPPNVEPPFLAPVSRSWARCCSLTSNRTGIRRWSYAPSRKRSFAVACWPCRECRR